jgi:hypothetical protein
MGLFHEDFADFIRISGRVENVESQSQSQPVAVYLHFNGGRVGIG